MKRKQLRILAALAERDTGDVGEFWVRETAERRGA
jgi:hypothetical protein